MRPIGRRAPRKHTVEGHQDCGICHPKDDDNRAREKRRARAEMDAEERHEAAWDWRHEEGLIDGAE